MKTRVALVDDNDDFRKRLVQRLGFFGQIDVVVEADNATEFLADVGSCAEEPHVALVDIDLPDVDGIELAARLRASHPDIGILMLTVFEAPDTILAAIQAGAEGYMLKDASADRIVEAITEVQQGGAPVSRTVARRVLQLLNRETSPDAKPEPEDMPLSPREVELLEHIVAGDTEAAIAERLCISPHTVRTHVKNIYRKLEVSSRAAAVRVAYERRLVGSNTRIRR
ncbi:MAG: response regulator [Acidobacteria bacterium]|nr:response regulator [Acidobacteriota bacterium]